MNERKWERLGAAGGLASALLLLVGLAVTSVPRGLGGDAAAIARYFGDNRLAVRFTALLVTAGAVMLLWFVGHLRHLLQRAEGGAEAFSPVVFVAGASLATMISFSVLPAVALAALTQRPEPIARSAVYALYDVHALSVGPIGLLAALFTATAGAAMVRREIAGPWLGWLGLAVAVVGVVCGVAAFFATGPVLTAMMYVIGIVFALWVGAASLVMLARPEVDRAAAPRAVFAPLGGQPT
jgi:hypothetical protein